MSRKFFILMRKELSDFPALILSALQPRHIRNRAPSQTPAGKQKDKSLREMVANHLAWERIVY